MSIVNHVQYPTIQGLSNAGITFWHLQSGLMARIFLIKRMQVHKIIPLPWGPLMQFSMGCQFRLLSLCRYNEKHSKMRNFLSMCNAQSKLKNTGWVRINIFWICSPPRYHCATHIHVKCKHFSYIFFFFLNFYCVIFRANEYKLQKMLYLICCLY